VSSGKVKVDDKKWRELRKRLEAMGADKAHVRVGVLSDDSHGDIGMIELAAIHEFGSEAAGIPERSFIRRTFRDRKEELTQLLHVLTHKIVTNKMTILQALNTLGLWGANAVKQTITQSDIPPPLKPSTIARKGSDKPLVDTGQLVNSITWKVENG